MSTPYPAFSGVSAPGVSVILAAGGWTRTGTVVHLTTVTDQVGIGTAAPRAGSTLDARGVTVVQGMCVEATTVDTTNSPYAVLSTDYAVFGDTSAGNLTVQLPDAAAALQRGRVVVVKKTSLLNSLTIISAGGTVETAAAGVGVTIAPGALTSLPFVSDGTNWWIV